MKEKVAANAPERLDAFQKGMQKFVGEVLKDFDKYQFWLCESMNPDAMVIMQAYREDQTTPYFIYFKDGLVEEKY